ncbi:MAG: beta-N-acetylhexosaminidase [Deltaproteobacteria bacterium]|nr:beta-N-acetylhexosaminidase [Deltaproteobacteria bacterium]
MKETIQKVSQLFVWGFEGTTVSASFRTLLKNYSPAGVILFKRNLEFPEQIKELTRSLQSEKSPLLIGIDEEGGRVGRLPDPFLHFPPAAILGKIFEAKKGKGVVTELGAIMARQLLSLGINTDFAPVLDVNSNPKNPIIGDRAFSSDPKVAADAALAFYAGMKSEGLVTCGKHFPGHGDTKTDSHLTLPRVSRDRRFLDKIELAPFRAAIQKKIPMLMTAHVVYKALDPKHPATLSSKILTDLLRKKLKFKGVVISDDLQMKAVAQRYSEVESSLLSLEAGVDLLLICRKGEEGGKIVEAVAREVAKSPALQTRVNESLRRVKRLI